jgi:hypothetical protein
MAPARQKTVKPRVRLFAVLAQSRGWAMAYHAAAAATLVLLLGAVCEKAIGDSAGAPLLFKLGLGAQAVALTCFAIAALGSRLD